MIYMPENNQYSNQYKEQRQNTYFYWKVFLVLLIILGAFSFLFFKGWLYIPAQSSSNNSDLPAAVSGGTGYQAIFLDNGQIYFGKITHMDEKTITLEDVYYIPSSANGQTINSQQINLVKLGSELHGPTDEMFITFSHILFYENLSPESKVLQSIQSAAAAESQ